MRNFLTTRVKSPKISTAFQFSMSFVILALIGSLLLWMPFFQRDPGAHSYFDHFLTSVSLVSVSGMGALPVGPTYNIFGQIICLILIQVGGLGVVTFINFGLYTMNQRISLKNQYMLQEVFSRDTNENFSSFLLSIYQFSIVSELIGSAILMIDFIPRYGFFEGIFNSFFLAVSAFNNSGFNNLGPGSLEPFNSNPLVLLTTSALVILGGIGFIVWFEVKERVMEYLTSKPRSLKLATQHLSVHTKIVLKTTAILLVSGTMMMFLIEVNNPESMIDMSAGDQFLNSFFLSVNSRTAGYTSIFYQDLQPITKFILMTLTIIGGAPGGTAGGIKVTSVAILYLVIRSELNGWTDVVVYKRTIPQAIVRKAILISLFFVIMLATGFGLLLLTHPTIPALDLMFETVNALGTSGISLNTTDLLNPFGKIILVILMLAGRVGPITLVIGLLQKKERKVKYADAQIHLG
ncbi:TrkH family potassium uptake protein [Aerococcaceae bacterium DSM 111022]|nr:TrkH family potassium uptake protein [Aerococcaceae bacterium DSM 111022]